MENYAIMPSLKGIRVKKRNFLEFSLGKDFPKIILRLRWPRLPHNLVLMFQGVNQ